MPIRQNGVLYLELIGDLPLYEALANVPEAVYAGMEDGAKTIRALAKRNTPRGYSGTRSRTMRRDPHAGLMKQSWSDVRMIQGGFTFENPVPYSEVLEEGRYPGLGPRTVGQGSSIYSRQAVGGILQPLIEDENLRTDIAQNIVEMIERALRR